MTYIQKFIIIFKERKSAYTLKLLNPIDMIGMKRNIINLNFREILLQKFPQRGQLVSLLMDILVIEKEAVYRRLRGEVPFSFEEVVIISRKLMISLDQLGGIEMKKRRPFFMQLTNFENPTKEDWEILENYNEILLQLSESGSFHTFETWPTIPFPFCYKYYNLAKFYLIKWAFQISNNLSLKPFEDISFSKRIFDLGLRSYELYSKATSSEYIVPKFIFRDLLKDISFFYELNVISKKILQLLIKEMEDCMTQWQHLTAAGKYPGSERKIDVYVTELNIDAPYTLMETPDEHICTLRSFTMNQLITSDNTTYNYIKDSFRSLKRFSTHISISGEKERLKFFDNEKAFIDEIKYKLFPVI